VTDKLKKAAIEPIFNLIDREGDGKITEKDMAFIDVFAY
jgi:hypothetical protein